MSSLPVAPVGQVIIDPVTGAFVNHVYDCECMKKTVVMGTGKVVLVSVAAVGIGYLFGVGTRNMYKTLRRQWADDKKTVNQKRH